MRLGEIPGRLYRGDISINIVSRQKMWYLISGCILLVSIAALLIRGLNFSVEFKGGSVFEFPATNASSGSISSVVSNAGGGGSTAQYVGGTVNQWHVTTGQLTSTVRDNVQAALQSTFHVATTKMNVQFIGPSWGSSITSKAIEALIIFMIVVVIYLSIAFEWKMAASAFVALLHDILITVGVYALVGFQVSPTSVVGLVTILGYSLYDTVVVFDKVRENTAGLITSERSTYSDAANLALNQTLVRSLNTSLTALIPVACILFIGVALLGTGTTLDDLSLVLFIGMMSGTYSSLCIATPVLADLKEREPGMRKLRERIERRQAGGRAAAKRAAASAGAASAGAKAGTAGTANVQASSVQASSVQASTVQAGTDQGDEAADDRDSLNASTADDEGEFTTASPAGQPAATRTTIRQQQARRPSGGSANRKKRR
jgi:preprotein translocase subunit SecF